MRRQAGIIGLLFFALAVILPLSAQIPGMPSPAPPAKNAPETDPLGRDTPFGCVMGFLKAAEREDFQRAVEYLDTKPSPQSLERAKQLYAVLNTMRVAGFETLSRTPEGDLNDGFPAVRERVGTVDTSNGKLDIMLDRTRVGGRPPLWLFSPETLRDVPNAFEQVKGFSIEDYIPQNLREIRVFSYPLYRWLGTLFGIGVVIVLGTLVGRILFPLIRPLVRRVTKEQDDRRLDALRPPLALILKATGFRILAELSLTVLGRLLWIRMTITLAVFGLTWLAIRISDVVAGRASLRLAQAGASSRLAILALSHRLFKIATALAGAVVIIYAVGGDITAILAGVGLGGIVIALAAQKTLENLFGGVALISDEPIRVGDFCRFDNKLGTVEDIGLRSARVRTLDRTVLSIPNGHLSTMTLENYTLRDRHLFNHNILLRYETTPAQIRSVLTQIRELIRNHPQVDRMEARVRLMELADSGFAMRVFAYVIEEDYLKFLEFQETMLLDILDIIVAAGSGLAYPSQTLYLTPDKPPSPSPMEPSLQTSNGTTQAHAL